MKIVFSVITLVAFHLPAVIGVQTARLEGRLVATDGSPVVGAEITADGTRQANPSDSAGRFVVESFAAGNLRLQVRAMGFAPVDTTLALGTASIQSVVIRMTRNVQVLAPVVTAALPYGKPERYRHTGKFDDFYERRARRPGTFFTREEIELSGRNSVVELMSSVPGVRVDYRGGRPSLRIPRCIGASIYGSQKPSADTADRSPASNAYRWLAVYVNGQRIGADPTLVLSELKLEEIETMEVYRGPSQLPMLAAGDACAAVFVTTRYTTGSVLGKN